MNKCWNCGIMVNDPSNVCPLCHSVLEKIGDETPSPTYPRAKMKTNKMRHALAIYTFCAIALEVLLILLHVALHIENWFVPILIGGLLVYTFITLKVSGSPAGYRARMLLQTFLGVCVVILIDLLTGFQGWAMNYVLPSAFILMNLAILILMVVNKKNWQSYIPIQMFLIVLCIAPFVLHYFGLCQDTIVCYIALIVSILEFFGTLLIGGKRARNELLRRFHF